MSLRCLFLTSVTAALCTQGVLGQRLHGRLLDLMTDEPVSSGLITLLTEDGVRLVTSVTGADGAWSLEAPEPGVYLVEAKRLGYQPWVDGPVEIKSGDDWESEYRLQPLAVAMDPIQVTAQATERYLRLVGFYERQRSDFGHFMNQDDIERRQGGRMTDLIAAVPGVRLVATGEASGQRRIQLRGGALAPDGMCEPRIIVDGLIYNRGDSKPIAVDDWGEPRFDEGVSSIAGDRGLTIDDVAHPSSVAAIEIYRSGSQVPVKFGGTSMYTQCGVIVIWTRLGPTRVGRD